jgi:hypothetical protein
MCIDCPMKSHPEFPAQPRCQDANNENYTRPCRLIVECNRRRLHLHNYAHTTERSR